MRRFRMPWSTEPGAPAARLAAVALVAALAPVALAQAGCARVVKSPADPGPDAPVVEYVSQQEVLTPLPLRVRLPQRYAAKDVLVFFHTWGSPVWGTLELARSGQTWSGEVSCREVSTVTGDTRYFFMALDEGGQVVGYSGSAGWPHVATVVGTLPGGPQTLRGESVPMRCHDPADCPPDFAGCPAYKLRRPACRTHGDCASGRRCEWDGYCSSDTPFAVTGVLTHEQADALLALTVQQTLQKYRHGGASTGTLPPFLADHPGGAPMQ